MTEQFVALPKVLLEAVLRQVYSCGGEDRENLRPYYVAESQPMVFWNIIRLFNGDYFRGLRELVPDVDWSYTGERRRELSSKAKENLRQKLYQDECKMEKQRRRERLRASSSTDVAASTTDTPN